MIATLFEGLGSQSQLLWAGARHRDADTSFIAALE